MLLKQPSRETPQLKWSKVEHQDFYPEHILVETSENIERSMEISDTIYIFFGFSDTWACLV